MLYLKQKNLKIKQKPFVLFLIKHRTFFGIPGIQEFAVLAQLKSVQSALSDLLTTSGTHGTFFRPSTKRGLILIGLKLNTNARESFEHC